MRTRRLLVPIDYNYYSPDRVVVGLRRCPPHNAGEEASVLRTIAAAEDGWQTLAVCDQRPIRWGRGCILRPVVEIAGSVAADLPRDCWHPVGA